MYIFIKIKNLNNYLNMTKINSIIKVPYKQTDKNIINKLIKYRRLKYITLKHNLRR